VHKAGEIKRDGQDGQDKSDSGFEISGLKSEIPYPVYPVRPCSFIASLSQA
jgi:hypothetical protein